MLLCFCVIRKSAIMLRQQVIGNRSNITYSCEIFIRWTPVIVDVSNTANRLVYVGGIITTPA